MPGERLLVYGQCPLLNYLTYTRPGLPYSWDFLEARPYGAAWVAGLHDKPRFAVTTMLLSETHGCFVKSGLTLPFPYGDGGDALHSFVRENYIAIEAPYPFILWERKDLPEAAAMEEKVSVSYHCESVGRIAPANTMRFAEWNKLLNSTQPRLCGQQGNFDVSAQGDSARVVYAGRGDSARVVYAGSNDGIGPALMWGFFIDLPPDHKTTLASIQFGDLDVSCFSGTVEVFFQDCVDGSWQTFVHALPKGQTFASSGLDAISRCGANQCCAGVILLPNTVGDKICLKSMDLTVVWRLAVATAKWAPARPSGLAAQVVCHLSQR